MTLLRFVVSLYVDRTELARYRDTNPDGYLSAPEAEWNLGQLNEAVEQHVATASVAPLELLDSDEL